MTQLTQKDFNSTKAGQLVYFFLSKAALKQMNITKLRLIKWLYLAERESYIEFGEPLVGDKLAAIQHGPVLSETLAMIEGKRIDGWHNIISVRRDAHRHQYVELADNCIYRHTDELDQFSDAEIAILNNVWQKYGDWSAIKLEKHLHDTTLFPEWQWKKGDKTNWIDVETMLESVGFEQKDIPQMAEKIVSFSIARSFSDKSE